MSDRLIQQLCSLRRVSGADPQTFGQSLVIVLASEVVARADNADRTAELFCEFLRLEVKRLGVSRNGA